MVIYSILLTSYGVGGALRWNRGCGEVGTAVGAVVRALKWEQRMW